MDYKSKIQDLIKSGKEKTNQIGKKVGYSLAIPILATALGSCQLNIEYPNEIPKPVENNSVQLSYLGQQGPFAFIEAKYDDGNPDTQSSATFYVETDNLNLETLNPETIKNSKTKLESIIGKELGKINAKQDIGITQIREGEDTIYAFPIKSLGKDAALYLSESAKERGLSGERINFPTEKTLDQIALEEQNPENYLIDFIKNGDNINTYELKTGNYDENSGDRVDIYIKNDSEITILYTNQKLKEGIQVIYNRSNPENEFEKTSENGYPHFTYLLADVEKVNSVINNNFGQEIKISENGNTLNYQGLKEFVSNENISENNLSIYYLEGSNQRNLGDELNSQITEKIIYDPRNDKDIRNVKQSNNLFVAEYTKDKNRFGNNNLNLTSYMGDKESLYRFSSSDSYQSQEGTYLTIDDVLSNVEKEVMNTHLDKEEVSYSSRN